MNILPSTINIIVTGILVILLLSLLFSIILMFGGSILFKKANKNPKTVYIPIVNLFTLLEVAEMSTFWGILYFIPVLNLLVMAIVSWKVGTKFNCPFIFKTCMVLFPIIFFPLLCVSDRQYKVSDDIFYKQLDDAKDESINLMTEEEVKAQNDTPIAPEKNVDSIFKSDIQMMEAVAPYKAAKVNVLDLPKLNNNTEEENPFEPILAAQPPEEVKTPAEEEVKKESKFTTELDKKDDVEFIDL